MSLHPSYEHLEKEEGEFVSELGWYAALAASIVAIAFFAIAH